MRLLSSLSTSGEWRGKRESQQYRPLSLFTLHSLLPVRLRQERPGAGCEPVCPGHADHADPFGLRGLDGVVVDESAGLATRLHDVVNGLVHDGANLGMIDLAGVAHALGQIA